MWMQGGVPLSHVRQRMLDVSGIGHQFLLHLLLTGVSKEDLLATLMILCPQGLKTCLAQLFSGQSQTLDIEISFSSTLLFLKISLRNDLKSVSLTTPLSSLERSPTPHFIRNGNTGYNPTAEQHENVWTFSGLDCKLSYAFLHIFFYLLSSTYKNNVACLVLMLF